LLDSGNLDLRDTDKVPPYIHFRGTMIVSGK
jgi:hypothetical protein